MGQQFTSTSVVGRALFDHFRVRTTGSPSTVRGKSDIMVKVWATFFEYVNIEYTGVWSTVSLQVRHNRIPGSTIFFEFISSSCASTACLLLHTSISEGLIRRRSSCTYVTGRMSSWTAFNEQQHIRDGVKGSFDSTTLIAARLLLG